MSDKITRMDRRKTRRYKAVEGAYAAIGPNSQKLGQILDISMGGLCFKYIDTGNGDQKRDLQPKGFIFLSSMAYYVGDLPFSTVDDYDVSSALASRFMKVRKRHVRFMDLSLNQSLDLEYYLKNNISEPV